MRYGGLCWRGDNRRLHRVRFRITERGDQAYCRCSDRQRKGKAG